MTTQTKDLFLPEDLDDIDRTSGLAASDRDALRAVRDWIADFVVQPNDQLGRPGPVCPFTSTSIQRQTLWLAAERLGEAGVPGLVELLQRYERRLLDDVPPSTGTDYGVIVVVLTDVPADSAPALFDGALQQVAVPSYVEDGIVFGPFYDGHPGAAIYNDGFHPFRSPVPFLFVRYGVVDDWKFFLGSDEMLGHWARRFGEQGARALAAELRQLPWNAPKQ